MAVPMYGPLTEGVAAGRYIVSEANGMRSRGVVTIASGSGVLNPGRVLAKLTAGGEYVPYDNVGTDGSEIAVAILWAKVDATSAAVAATAHVRDMEYNEDELDWGAVDAAGITAGKADLAAVGIIARNTVATV